jgi:hypothetical protein
MATNNTILDTIKYIYPSVYIISPIFSIFVLLPIDIVVGSSHITAPFDTLL